MKDFATTWHCRSRAHCHACRNDPAWRATMAKTFIMPKRCWRVTGLGDAVAIFLKLPGVSWFVTAATGINPHKPCAGCRKRQAMLNRAVPLGRAGPLAPPPQADSPARPNSS